MVCTVLLDYNAVLLDYNVRTYRVVERTGSGTVLYSSDTSYFVLTASPWAVLTVLVRGIRPESLFSSSGSSH